jgi:flagellar FliJ protein
MLMSDKRPAAEGTGILADYRGMSSPSFRFRLERVRALRERSEDAAKQELAQAMSRRFECETQVAAAEERLVQARATAHAVFEHGGSLLARQAYLEAAELAHREQLQQLDLRHAEVDSRRDELAIAARERQALERLKEHRFAAHQRETLRLEGRLLDEIAGQNSYRKAA